MQPSSKRDPRFVARVSPSVDLRYFHLRTSTALTCTEIENEPVFVTIRERTETPTGGKNGPNRVYLLESQLGACFETGAAKLL